MKLVLQKKTNRNLLRFQLGGESAQSGLIGVVRHAEGQLDAKLLRELTLQSKRSLIVERLAFFSDTEPDPQLLLRKALHPNKQTALASFPARPCRN